MLQFLLDNLAAVIVSALSAVVALTTLVSLFIDIKKKKVSTKAGIKIVVGISLAVLLVALVHLYGEYSALKASSSVDASTAGLLSSAQEEDTSKGTAGDTVITDSTGVTIIQGDNNSVNVTVNEKEGPSTAPPMAPVPPVTVHQVLLNETAVELMVGASHTLTAAVLYSDNTTDDTVKWISSNEEVAVVDDHGNMEAKTPGKATITAQASKNNSAGSASCDVTVSAPVSAPTGYSIRLSTRQAVVDEPFVLYIEPYGDDVTDIQVYTISPSGVKDDFPYGNNGRYSIYTELGTWTIYASVANEAGIYMAEKPDDYVTINIISIEEFIGNIMQGTTAPES